MGNVIALAEQFRADLIAGDAATLAAMTRRWLTVEKALAAEVEALAEEMAALTAAGESVPVWKLFQMQRYQSLLAQTGQEISTYNQWAAGQIGAQQAEAREMADEHAKALILEGLDANRKTAVAWDRLPTGAVENIAAIAQAGQPLNKLLANAYPAAAQQLTNLLITNTALGKNPRETARTAVRKGLAAGLNHILLVARDQQIRNYREMTRTRYDRSPVVYGYMRLAAKNLRTCMACLALDGSVWETGKVMPIHPQDRCVAQGQRVTTADGEKPIEEVAEGDMVLTQNGRFRRVIKTKARHYSGPMVRLKWDGRELVVTPDHKIKTQRGWVEARDLTAEDILETF